MIPGIMPDPAVTKQGQLDVELIEAMRLDCACSGAELKAENELSFLRPKMPETANITGPEKTRDSIVGFVDREITPVLKRERTSWLQGYDGRSEIH